MDARSACRCARRRRQSGAEKLPPLPVVEDGHFREVKTGVLLLPQQRGETSPGRRSVARRFLVSCLGDADAIFHRLYAQLRELGWLGSNTMVVIVGDGAEWIWNRATWSTPRTLLACPTAKDRSKPISGSTRSPAISKPAMSSKSSRG